MFGSIGETTIFSLTGNDTWNRILISIRMFNRFPKAIRMLSYCKFTSLTKFE